MRHLFFVAVVVASLALVPTAPAAAQSVGSSTPTETPGPQPTAENGTERIDNQTTIIESRLVTEGNQSVVMLTLRSEMVQTIAISDASAFRQGGVVPVRSVVMDSGQTATYEIAVNSSGVTALSISTENTALYAEIVKKPDSSGSGGLDVMRVLGSLQAWGAGVVGAFLWMILAGYSVLSREDGSPEVAT